MSFVHGAVITCIWHTELTSRSGLQWNWAVELLPMWLAPNMVTLIGFMFILANIALMAFMVPDLVGPVSVFDVFGMVGWANVVCRLQAGYISALRWVCGCIQPWITLTANKQGEPGRRVV
jgi:hypothetical protein